MELLSNVMNVFINMDEDEVIEMYTDSQVINYHPSCVRCQAIKDHWAYIYYSFFSQVRPCSNVNHTANEQN